MMNPCCCIEPDCKIFRDDTTEADTTTIDRTFTTGIGGVDGTTNAPYGVVVNPASGVAIDRIENSGDWEIISNELVSHEPGKAQWFYYEDGGPDTTQRVNYFSVRVKSSTNGAIKIGPCDSSGVISNNYFRVVFGTGSKYEGYLAGTKRTECSYTLNLDTWYTITIKSYLRDNDYFAVDDPIVGMDTNNGTLIIDGAIQSTIPPYFSTRSGVHGRGVDNEYRMGLESEISGDVFFTDITIAGSGTNKSAEPCEQGPLYFWPIGFTTPNLTLEIAGETLIPALNGTWELEFVDTDGEGNTTPANATRVGGYYKATTVVTYGGSDKHLFLKLRSETWHVGVEFADNSHSQFYKYDLPATNTCRFQEASLTLTDNSASVDGSATVTPP